MEAAIERLDATRLNDGRYVYRDDGTQTYYVIDEWDIEMLDEMMANPDVQDAYSEWCGATDSVEAPNAILAEIGASDGYRCECGEATGERCAWTGSRNEMVTVEWMPAHLRAAHAAADNWGSYPHNGAVRLLIASACADRLRCTGDDYDDCEADNCPVHAEGTDDGPEWARIVEA